MVTFAAEIAGPEIPLKCPGPPECGHCPACACRSGSHGRLCRGCRQHARVLGLDEGEFLRRYNVLHQVPYLDAKARERALALTATPASRPAL